MDLFLRETGQGGDLVLLGNDIARVLGLDNTPYLAMFGGTAHWADYMTPETPYNSKTENALKVTPVTSAGRKTIDNAVQEDLAYLNDIPGTVWSAAVSIPAADRWRITVVVNGKDFVFEWGDGELVVL